MQDRLKVGNYAKKGSASDVAEEPGAEMTGTINKEGVERSEEQQKIG